MTTGQHVSFGSLAQFCEQPDHSANLGDSITASIRIRFSVHTPKPTIAISQARITSLHNHNREKQAISVHLVGGAGLNCVPQWSKLVPGIAIIRNPYRPGSRSVMSDVDVLIVTGLQMEYEAACEVGLSRSGSPGIVSWEQRRQGLPAPYVIGDFISNGKFMRVALAHGQKMSGRYLSYVAAYLLSELKPRCIAMSGACAGNPDDAAFGDVIVADMTFQYDEGKVTQRGFLPDHRPDKLRDSTWVDLLGKLKPKDYPSYGDPSDSDADLWLLEQISLKRDVRIHPARNRYFPDELWEDRIKGLMAKKLIYLKGARLTLASKGRTLVNERRLLGVLPPAKLPFSIKIGPMASGNVVVKDNRWTKLQGEGIRTVLGLEMEAATVGGLGTQFNLDWIVMKAVMDYGDRNKDDRFKSFAARASAEVLFPFLMSRFGRKVPDSVRSIAEIARNNATGSGVLERIAMRAFIEVIAAFYKADFLPGGGIETIPRWFVSPFVSKDLMAKIAPGLKFNGSLEDIAEALLDRHLIDDALTCLNKKILFDWDNLPPHTKLLMHDLSKKYPTIGLGPVPELTEEEREIVAIKWLVSDGMFSLEWRSWTDQLAEVGLDLIERKLDTADLHDAQKVEYYCNTFESLIATRIEIDLALVKTSTSVSFGRVVNYLSWRAERTEAQVMAIVDEICRSFPQPHKANELLAVPMRNVVAPLIKKPLQVAPPPQTMKAMREALEKYV
jgi:nucleoside phosphorylase